MAIEPIKNFFSNIFGPEKKTKSNLIPDVINKTHGDQSKTLVGRGVLPQQDASKVAARTQILTGPLHNYGSGKDIVCECSQGRLRDVRDALKVDNPDKDIQGSHACAVICFRAIESFLEKGLPKNVQDMYELMDQGVKTYTQKNYEGDLYFDDVYYTLKEDSPHQLEDFIPKMEEQESETFASAYNTKTHLDPVFAALQEKVNETGGKTCGVLTISIPKRQIFETMVIMFDENQKPALFNSHGTKYEGRDLGASLRRFESMEHLAKYIKTEFYQNEEGDFDLKILSKIPQGVKSPSLPQTGLSDETTALFHECFDKGIDDFVNHPFRDLFLNQMLENQDNLKASLTQLKTLLNGRTLNASFRSKPELLMKLCHNTLNESPDLFRVSPEIKDHLKGCVKEENMEAVLPENFISRAVVIRKILEDQDKFNDNLEKFKSRLEGKKLITENLDNFQKTRLLLSIVEGGWEEIMLYRTEEGVSLINPVPFVPFVPFVSTKDPALLTVRSQLARDLHDLLPPDIHYPLMKSIMAKNPSVEQYGSMAKKISELKQKGPFFLAEGVDHQAFLKEFEKVLGSQTNANPLNQWLDKNGEKWVWEIPFSLVQIRKSIDNLPKDLQALFDKHFEQGLEGILPENYYSRSASLDSINNAQELFAKHLEEWSARLRGEKLVTHDLTDVQKENLLFELVHGKFMK
jgi:hypothetical protein